MSEARRTTQRLGEPLGGVLALVLLGALPSGCDSDEGGARLPNDRVWESPHFRYHTRSTDEGACEEVLRQLEWHFEVMQKNLGFAWREGDRVDYYKFLDREDYLANSACPDASGSCTRGSSVLSPYPVQDHELIHAYLSFLSLPPAFFTEGIAEILSCTHAWDVNPAPPEDVVALPFGDDRVYVEGPWFVGHLVHEYGPAAFLRLYGELDYRESFEEIAAVFEATYAQKLADVWNAALLSSHRVRCINLWSCLGAELKLDGSAQSLARICDGTDHTRTFELDSDVDMVFAPDGHFLYAPLGCDDELPYSVGGNPGDDTLLLTEIAPVARGRYFVAAWEDSAEVRAFPLPSRVYSQICTESQPVTLDTNQVGVSEFVLSIPSDGMSWYVRLHVGGGHQLWSAQVDASIRLEECAGCGAVPVCQPLVGYSHLDAEGEVTVRLTSLSTGPGYVSSTFGYE